MDVIAVSPGELVLSKGKLGTVLIRVINGTATAYRNHQIGNKVPYQELSQDCVFGEEVFMHEECLAVCDVWVEATTECRIVRLEQQSLVEMLKTRQDFRSKLQQNVSWNGGSLLMRLTPEREETSGACVAEGGRPTVTTTLSRSLNPAGEFLTSHSPVEMASMPLRAPAHHEETAPTKAVEVFDAASAKQTTVEPDEDLVETSDDSTKPPFNTEESFRFRHPSHFFEPATSTAPGKLDPDDATETELTLSIAGPAPSSPSPRKKVSRKHQAQSSDSSEPGPGLVSSERAQLSPHPDDSVDLAWT